MESCYSWTSPRSGAYSSPVGDGQVLAVHDSWHSDAFAGAAGGGKCPALALMAEITLVEIELLEWQSGLAMTSSAARSDAGLECCHRSRCSFVGFAGSYLRHSGLLAAWKIEVVVDCLDLPVPAIAGLDRSRCTTS